jgi:hypothetical protein
VKTLVGSQQHIVLFKPREFSWLPPLTSSDAFINNPSAAQTSVPDGFHSIH